MNDDEKRKAIKDAIRSAMTIKTAIRAGIECPPITLPPVFIRGGSVPFDKCIGIT